MPTLARSWLPLVLALIAVTAHVNAQETKPVDPKVAEKERQEATEELAILDGEIAKQPDKPTLHYARAQLLAKLAKHDEAYAAAQTTMAKYIKAEKQLAWLQLDAFEVDGHKVLVLFNMGEDERQPPAEFGITRPLTFRIFNKEGNAILDAFDFEIGYIDGKPTTGCFGKTLPNLHANLGPVDPATPYSKLRPAAMELAKKLAKKE